MAQEVKRAVTPVGRIIWGSVSELNTRDKDGKPEPDADKHRYSFGLAILKNQPGINEFFGGLYQQAIAGYPNNQMMAQRIQNQWQQFGNDLGGSGFKFKVKNGDAPLQRTGKPDPNAAGCWVIAFSTKLPITCSNTLNQQIDAKEVERGYFVEVATAYCVNEKLDHTAGMFVNPGVVRLLGFGEKIVGGVSIDDAFAGHAVPTQLPPGASFTPVAPSGGIPGFPGPGGGAPQGMNPGGYPAGMPANGFPNPSNIGPTVQTGVYPSNPQGMPMGGGSQGMPMGGGAPQGMPMGGGQQLPGLPQGGGAPGFPAPQAGGNPPYATGYPINPQTGQPYQPMTGFASGPGTPPGS